MNLKINSNDDILFDRLVDGEISGDDRRRLLSSLDDRPGGWRRCALAFLEAQSWRADLPKIAAEDAVIPLKPASRMPFEDRRIWRRAVRPLAMAAGLFLAFGLGLAWRGVNRDIASGQPISTEHIADGSNKATLLAEPSAPSRDAMTFWVRNQQGAAQPVHVPLVDAQALDQQLGVEFRSGVPDAVRQQLEQRGYDVRSTRRYAPLWLENGRSLVVPVEDTRIVPVSPVVY
jgi:hypothetical protein